MMNEYDLLGHQALMLTENLTFAIRGIFHNVRKVGVSVTPQHVRLGRVNVRNSVNLYDQGIKTLVGQGESKSIQYTLEQIDRITAQLLSKGEEAIKSGITNGAATYLGNQAHGAMGELVGATAQTIDFSVRDTAGRLWKSPSKLVQTIVRDFHYQAKVDDLMNQLKSDGHLHFSTDQSNEVHDVENFHKLRPYLFHVNSNQLPRTTHV